MSLISFKWILQEWCIFLIIIFILIFFKSSFGKGIIGEFIINTATKLLLDKNKYHLIKNVILPTKDGTTQIDHIIVSEYGIFVIETKNMKGWIFGNERQKYWTQKIYKYTNKFQNPLHQNYKHIKTLEIILGISCDKMFSVIVFIGNSKFKTKMPKNVTQGIGYIDYIKSHTRKIIPKDEVNKIVSKIESEKFLNSFKTYQKHIKHVNDISNKYKK